MKIYTKTGDDGSTGILGSGRLSKDHQRIEAYGDVDEANACLGAVIAFLAPQTQTAVEWIDAIQSDLFVIGGLLATAAGTPETTALAPQRTEWLEQRIDALEKDLPPLKNFVLPQGTRAAALLHVARTVCRRAERHVVALASHESINPTVIPYLNRLSDFIFVLARWVNFQEDGLETPWINPSATPDGPPAPTPDRMAATLRKLEEDKKRRQTLFEQTAADLQKKKAQAEKLFSKNVKKIHDDGGVVEPDVRPIDLD
jgi:cob(I)alamin adenosyltransferase